MTTALPPKSETRVVHGHADLALTLELEPDSATALLRTLVLLHRRRCRVTEARYQSGIGGSDRLDLVATKGRRGGRDPTDGVARRADVEPSQGPEWH
jgi:hypothetical protein